MCTCSVAGTTVVCLDLLACKYLYLTHFSLWQLARDFVFAPAMQLRLAPRHHPRAIKQCQRWVSRMEMLGSVLWFRSAKCAFV
jgi:hypothetical protein